MFRPRSMRSGESRGSQATIGLLPEAQIKRALPSLSKRARGPVKRLWKTRAWVAPFCGSIGGSVTVRRNETPEQALARAEEILLALLERGAKRLSDDGMGPNICLELDEVR